MVNMICNYKTTEMRDTVFISKCNKAVRDNNIVLQRNIFHFHLQAIGLWIIFCLILDWHPMGTLDNSMSRKYKNKPSVLAHHKQRWKTVTAWELTRQAPAMMNYKSDKETVVLRLWPFSIEIHSKLEFSARLGKFFPVKVLRKTFESEPYTVSVWFATRRLHLDGFYLNCRSHPLTGHMHHAVCSQWAWTIRIPLLFNAGDNVI